MTSTVADLTVPASSLLASPLGADCISEKPGNGFQGLKHWRYDLLAGFVVALISTPFSLGVAIASGAPPISGLTSAIIAGVIMPFLGGSYVTISGPAAGLAPALFTAMLTLGGGNLALGYPLLLPLIAAVGVCQLVLSALKAARFSLWFPAPVIEGMLTAIGLMLIVKQIPLLMGRKFASHDFWSMLWEAPQHLANTNPLILGLGLGTLGLIVLLSRFSGKSSGLKWFPPQMLAVMIVTMLSLPFCLIQGLRVNIPDNPLQHGIVWPDFQGVLSHPQLWWSALGIVLTLTLIDGIESLATIQAIDKIDPFRRKSSPDRTLFSMGVLNICSSMIGGLTIIPGGVKSTTNISAGGRTQWANFFNACFLLSFLLFLRPAINAIPLAVTAGVLTFTGYKLCKPDIWKHIASHGTDQFFLFVATVVLTLTTDLMWGIMGGVTLSFLMNTCLLAVSRKYNMAGKHKSWLTLITDQFRSPIAAQRHHADQWWIVLNKPLVSFNVMYIHQALKQLPPMVKTVMLMVEESVCLIDHTTVEHLHRMIEDAAADGQVSIQLKGLEPFKTLGKSLQATYIIPAGDGLELSAAD